MLQDALGRTFYYLRLSVTDVCNFRCIYCLPNGYQGGEDTTSFLTLPEITQTLNAFAALGVRKVRLTGGEPSTRADLPDIIANSVATTGISKVALTTNGYRLPKKIKQWADAGLHQLTVSIDSLDSQQFHDITGHDRLNDVLAGVDKALALGIDTKINAVLMRDVNDQLESFLAWLKDTPVTLRFIELMETSDQKVFFRQHHQNGEALQKRLIDQGWQVVIRSLDAGPAQEYWHPDYRGRLGLIRPYSKDFCTSCNRLRISSTGRLHLCLFSEQGLDVRPWMQPKVPSEVLQQNLVRLLANKAPTHLLQQHQSGASHNLSRIGG